VPFIYARDCSRRWGPVLKSDERSSEFKFSRFCFDQRTSWGELLSFCPPPCALVPSVCARAIITRMVSFSPISIPRRAPVLLIIVYLHVCVDLRDSGEVFKRVYRDHSRVAARQDDALPVLVGLILTARPYFQHFRAFLFGMLTGSWWLLLLAAVECDLRSESTHVPGEKGFSRYN
jgi:hypothetical protein